MLRDAEIRREKMDVWTAMEEADCGFGCLAYADNIWGVRLIVLADLLDLRSGTGVWRGVGGANAITSRVSHGHSR